MKFCEYRDLRTSLVKSLKHSGNSGDTSVRNVYFNAIQSNSASGKAEISALLAEWQWWSEERPYFNVFPSMCDVLRRFAVERIPVSALIPRKEKVIAIQFCEPIDGINACLVGCVDTEHGVVFVFRVHSTETYHTFGLDHPWYYDAILQCPAEYRNCALSDIPNADHVKDIHKIAMRIGLSVMLMEHDPDFFEPHVLTADQTKFDNAKSEEHRQALINKAVKKRGRRGYVIGRQMETIPHFRRPHPALRWTGKGGKIPKVVMVKGSIVHRSKLTQVPTGRYGSEEVVS